MLTPRGRAIGDAAIAVLADGGSRALTHRAVDDRAGLPQGATSNLARTRAALLDLALARTAELDIAAFAEVARGAAADLAGLAELLAATTYAVLTTHRDRTLARYELAMESTRRPALRARFAAEGAVLRAHAREVLVAAGSAEPDRHTALLRAFLEGLLFTTAIDGQRVPDAAELARAFGELLSGMLGRPGEKTVTPRRRSRSGVPASALPAPTSTRSRRR